MKALIRKNILELKPYSSARDEFKEAASVYLDANEFPVSSDFNRYPDSHHSFLKNAISKIKNVSEKNILIGNGSDEVIDIVLRTFCEPGKDNIIITPPTYGMYEVAAAINDIEVKRCDLEPNFELDFEKLKNQIDVNTKVVFLCSPNNPTGKLLDFDAICDFVSQVSCMVLVDEAYIDFSDSKSMITKIDEFDNLIVSQTLSKFYGMAGLRVGLCFANSFLIEIFHKVKPPYNINILSQKIAIKELNSKDWESSLQQILKDKQNLKAALLQQNCILQVFESDANFYLVKVANATHLYQYLIKKGIVVRNRSNQLHCENCLRITVGTAEENEELINALREYEV